MIDSGPRPTCLRLTVEPSRKPDPREPSGRTRWAPRINDRYKRWRTIRDQAVHTWNVSGGDGRSAAGQGRDVAVSTAVAFKNNNNNNNSDTHAHAQIARNLSYNNAAAEICKLTLARVYIVYHDRPYYIRCDTRFRAVIVIDQW